MTREQQPTTPVFAPISVGAGRHGEPIAHHASHASEQTELLHQILVAQDRQNELLEELVANATAAQRQRVNELNQWRQANPDLAEACRQAAEALAQVQTEFLQSMTEEVRNNAESLIDGEFVFNEFVDRFGPRLAHLNGVLQMLSQLSSPTEAGRDG
ncbi:MAG: YebO family protein [Planctomycetia bacterium]|nr:YebO family protein [Planctomycetia bacterium]